MGWLDDQVAIVTGGGSGIGRGVVRRFVEEGARVCVVDLEQDRLDAIAAELGDAVIAVRGDVTTVEGNRAAIQATLDAWGHIDTFVANAGRGDAFTELIDIPEDKVAEAYKDIFDVNVKGVIMGARCVVSELVKTRGCFIVTLSNSSFWPDGGGVMYIGSKHAALGVVRQLAHEFAPYVRVNAVSPGATRTDIRLPASFGTDEEGNLIRTHSHPSNLDEAVEACTPLAMHADPEDHSGAYVLIASRREGKVMAGTVIETDAGLGIRGLRRVRGGDELPERLGVAPVAR
jgi:NAD(P)-dependent dehydrogenase (short-subunit alcohol dehydrogenase family)